MQAIIRLLKSILFAHAELMLHTTDAPKERRIGTERQTKQSNSRVMSKTLLVNIHHSLQSSSVQLPPHSSLCVPRGIITANMSLWSRLNVLNDGQSYELHRQSVIDHNYALTIKKKKTFAEKSKGRTVSSFKTLTECRNTCAHTAHNSGYLLIYRIINPPSPPSCTWLPPPQPPSYVHTNTQHTSSLADPGPGSCPAACLRGAEVKR